MISYMEKFKFFFKEKLTTKSFYGCIIPLLIIFIILGFCLDSKNFSLNLLANLSSILIGALFTLFILDIYNQIQRERKWEIHKKTTFRQTQWNLFLISIAISRAFIKPDVYLEIKNKYLNNPKTFNGNTLFLILQELLKEENISCIKNDYQNKINIFIDHSTLLIDSLNSLLPRLLELEEEQNKIDIIASLIETLLTLKQELFFYHIDIKYREIDNLSINSFIATICLLIQQSHMFLYVFRTEKNQLFDYSIEFTPIVKFLDLTKEKLDKLFNT